MAAPTRLCLVQKLRRAGAGVTTPGNEQRLWCFSYWAWRLRGVTTQEQALDWGMRVYLSTAIVWRLTCCCPQIDQLTGPLQPESTRTKLEQRMQLSYSHMISLCFLDSPWLPGCGLRQCAIGQGACGLAGYSRQAGPYISIVSKIRVNFRCLSVTSTISLLVNALLQHQRAGNWGAP